MASVKNLILNFVFQTQGAGSTARDLNNLNKAQTRLGQSSASAGRSFSSQAQGLGGLVAAYAGAAATTFALQQAFDKLAKSARTIQTLEGLNTLASSVGASGSQLLESVREITKAQLTIADSAAQINLSLSAGFNTQQIERLSGVALKASRALGRDLNDAYTRVVRGSAKMETELLDELGIYTKIEPATRAYAAAIGKSVTSLSEFERRQAFVNAVITEGERKYAGINTTLATTAEKLEAFGTKMLDIAMLFGMELVQKLEPIIDFFADNFPAAIALAIAAAGLLARKGIGELSNYLANATKQKLNNATALENLIRKYTGLAPAAIKASESIGKITAATSGLSKAEKDRFNALQATSQQRALTGPELKNINELSKKVANSYASQAAALRNTTAAQYASNQAIQQEKASREAALRTLKAQETAIKSNTALTAANRRAQLNAISPQIAGAQARVNTITPLAQQSQADTKAALAQYAALLKAKNEYNRAVQSSGAAMTGWAAKSAAALGTVYRGWSLATAGVLAFTSKIVSGLGGIISSVAILSIAVTALASLFGKSDELNAYISETAEALKRLFGGGLISSSAKAIESLGGATLESLEKVNSELKNTDSFSFKKKFLTTEVEVVINKEQLIKSASSRVSEAAVDKGFLGKLADNITDFNWIDVGASIGGAILGGMAAVALAPATGGASIAAFGLAVSGGIAGAIAGDVTANTLITGVETANRDLNEEFGVSVERVNELRSQFGSYFKEIDTGLRGQDIRLASVLDKEAKRIGAGSILTADQREYLTVFAKVAVSQFNQLKNLEAIVSLSKELGKNAGQISTIFNITQDSTSTFAKIKTNLEAIAADDPINLPVTFTLVNKETGEFKRLQEDIKQALPSDRLDLFTNIAEGDTRRQKALAQVKAGINQYDEYVRDAIRKTGSLEGAVAELDSIFSRPAQSVAIGLKNLGISAEDALAVLESGGLGVLDDIIDGFNSASISSIRAADNFNTLAKQAREGGLTFEQFQQGLAGVDTALSDGSTKINALIPQLTELAKKYPTGPIHEAALALLEQSKAQQENNEKVRAQLIQFKEQENYYKRITQYAVFLKAVQDSTKVNEFDYEAQTTAATKLISIDQARLQVLIDQANAQKKLSDEAKKAIQNGPGRDRQGTGPGANAVQLQALGEYEQSLENAAALLMEQRVLIMKSVVESQKLTSELDKQILAEQTKLSIVKNQAAAEQKLISLRENASAADLAVFNTEKALEGITAQIELNDKLFSIEESRAERAKNQLDLIQEATQAAYSRQIEAVQAVAAEEDRASARRVANLERQIQQINSVRDLAKNVDQAITALQLSFLKAPTIEQAPAEDTFSKEIALRRQLLQEEITAAERSASNQKSILNLQAQQESAAVRNDITQLTNENVLANRRVKLLQDQRALLIASEDKQLQLLRAQDDARKAAAAIDLANLQRQKVDLAVKYSQDVKNLDNERQLAVKKATDDINANIRYLESIQTQKNVFDDFLDTYGALIKAQASVVGKQVDLPAKDAGELDFNKLMGDLKGARQEIADSYKSLYSLQEDALLVTVLSSQAALDQEISAIQGKTEAENAAFEKSIVAREALKAVNIAATDEEIAAAQQAANAILARRNEQVQKIKDIETKLQRDIVALDAQTGDARIAAQQKLQDFIVSGMNEVISSMEDAASRYQDIVIDSYTQIRALAAEKIQISAKIDLDRAAFERQLTEVKKQYEIERLQGDVNLIEAKKSSGSMPAMDAAKAINDKQQEILTAQGQLVELERTNALANIKAEQDAAYKLMQDNQKRIQQEADLQKAKIQTEMDLLTQQGEMYKANIESLQEANKNNNDALAGTFNNAVVSFNATLKSFGDGFAKVASYGAGETLAFNMANALQINAGALDDVKTKFDDVALSMRVSGALAKSSVQEAADAAKAVEATKFRQTYEGLQQEAEMVAANADQKAAMLKNQAAIEAENAKARLKDAEKGGEKQKEKLKELQDKYNDAIGKVKDAFLNLLKDYVEAIGSVITKNLERKVEMAKVNETIANANLAATSEKLSEATSKQQELMQKEISLRDEIQESYKTLAETQKTYINSLTGDDRSIKQSSRALIDGILDQKRKQIDLSKTINQRIRQDSFVQTLEERKLYQERALEDATNTRIAAEEQLANTQAMIAQITSIVSGEMFKLANSLQALMQAMGGVNEVVGMGAKEGFGVAQLSGGLKGLGNQIAGAFINNGVFGAGGVFTKAVNGLVDAGKSLFGAGSKIANAVGTAGSVKSLAPTTSLRPMANPLRAGASGGFWSGVGSAIGGGFTGLGVGSIVGALTKDPGMGSTIGGAIGGAIAGAFPALITSIPVLNAVAGGLATGLGMALNFAIPVVGAVIGAFIGRAFSKNPKAGAVGNISGTGEKTINSSYGRKVPSGTAENLSDLTGGISSLIGSLKTIGIAFKDTLTYSVSFYKDRLNASLFSSNSAAFEAPSAKANEKGSQQIADFFLDSFLKSLKSGSLVVDNAIKGAADLQAAIDKFVNEDQSTKTIDRLKEVLEYAAGFSEVLAKLGEAVPVTMEDAIASIVEGSKANASAIIAQYDDLRRQAADVFGTTSAQYATLNKKIKENALAQLGLAAGSDGIIRSVAKANDELNAGTLAIANIVEGISAFETALVSAGFAASDAASIIDLALNTQLTDFIGSIGENLKNSIDVLKNPAVQAAIELEAIIENAADRNKQAEGVLAGLRAAESRIEQSNIDSAITNVSRSIELGALEVERYLESLNIEQLKAVIADEDRIDAATRLAASSRLVAMEDQDRAQAAKQFVKVSREFNKSLAEITKSSAIPQFVNQATSVIEIAQLLGRNSIDQFSIDFANLINSISRGENISGNFEAAIAGLNDQITKGTITYTQLVGALDLLQSTALDSIQVLADLVSSVEETTSQIYDLYSTSLDNLVTATDEVGSSFSDLLDGFKEKTQSVLGLFDDTLKSVAESGNKLYTLRDNAKEAFDSASKAVAEFEKTNKITGRTVAQVTAELTSVSSQITALSAKPFDFASFLNLGSLSSKQRSLQVELSTLGKVQEEYSKLIADRTTAEQDYLFANKTVSDLEASTTAKLLDTRIKESETIQEVKDAALEFVTSQKDLQDITQLLTAANFNLNQARFEERDRVVQVSEALRDLSVIAGNLVAEATSISTTDVNKVQAQAKLAAEIQYGTAATTQITAAVNQAVAEFNSLKAVASSVTSVVNSTVGVGTSFANAVKTTSDTLKIYDSLLTDSFEGYTKTISGYVTNINAILKTSFDTTDTTNFNGFITNLNKTQDALQLLSPTLNQLLADSKLGVIAGVTQSIGESVGTFQNNIISAVSGLLDAFSPERKSKVDAFRTALDEFDKVGATINDTGGLKDALVTSRANTSGLSSNLTTLAANFLSLNTEVAKLNDTTNTTTKAVTPGQLSQARAKITEIATALQTAWDNVKFTVSTNLGTGITVNANVNAGSALTTQDRGNLKSIATNSGRFPAIAALGTAGYTAGTMPGAAAAFAEGGYVKGPGSETSDSIPAKLSNGEYVIKASSVKRVGKNLLDEINNSGNLNYALAKQGRNGDSLVAHINSKEASMLRRNGGSGTFNPATGLLEFFNNDGGAYGGLFETQEVDKLVNSFSNVPNSVEQLNGVSGFARMDGTVPANQNSTGKVYPWNPGAIKNLAMFGYDELLKVMSTAMTLSSRPAEARGFGGITGLSYGIGDPDKYMNSNNIVMRSNGGVILSHGATNGAPVGVGPEGYFDNRNKYNGGLAARLNQTVRLANHMYGGEAIGAAVDSPGISRAVVSDYVKSLNKRNKMFFDFYMLKSGSANNRTGLFPGPGASINTSLLNNVFSQTYTGFGDSQGRYNSSYSEYAPALAIQDTSNPFSQASLGAGTYQVRDTDRNRNLTQSEIQQRFFSAGGLVTNPRDSVSAMLEPGEFVLRKQAVDRMGIDSAIRLNSTGSVNGDIDVEVNINNNGTSQTTVGTPEVRRENGKIVVDIILEDLRTNGPINRQIRSIR